MNPMTAMHAMETSAIGFRPNRSARNPEYTWAQKNPKNPSEARSWTIVLSQKSSYWVITVAVTQLSVNSNSYKKYNYIPTGPCGSWIFRFWEDAIYIFVGSLVATHQQEKMMTHEYHTFLIIFYNKEAR